MLSSRHKLLFIKRMHLIGVAFYEPDLDLNNRLKVWSPDIFGDMTAVKPAVQLLQIQEVHPVAHSSACNFCHFLSIFLLVLSRPSFTSRTPNKDQKTEQLFYFLLVQVPYPGDIHELRSKRFCACYLQVLTKSASRKKWYVLVPLDGFP